MAQIAELVKQGREIEISDDKTGEDVTAFILTQIVLEEAKKKTLLLPVSLLYLLIRYGDSVLSEFFDNYLEQTLKTYLTHKSAMDSQFRTWLELGQDFSTLTTKAMANLYPAVSVDTIFSQRRRKKRRKRVRRNGCPLSLLKRAEQVAENDHGNESDNWPGHGYRKNVEIGIAMAKVADLEQGNNGAAMGQAVQPAGGQGGDPVHKVQRDARGGGHLSKLCSHGLENNAHAAGGRPVMPARTLTERASETRGLSPPSLKMPAAMVAKAGRIAITAPKPTRLAVLKMGMTEALAPESRLFVKSENLFRLSIITSTMEPARAAMMDQIPCTRSKIRCTILWQGEKRRVQGRKNQLAEEIIEDNDQDDGRHSHENTRFTGRDRFII